MSRVPLPSASIPWIDKEGRPTQAFIQHMTAQAAGKTGPYISAADDVAAAKAGVAINQVYELAGGLRIRKT